MTETLGAMPVMAHLYEFRSRLLRSLIALVIATSISLVFVEPLLKLLVMPYGNLLQVIHPAESISTCFSVALKSGTILAMPFIVYQIVRFLVPGLTRKERWYLILLLPGATLCFVTGVAFAWIIMFPTVVRLLSGFAPDIFKTEWTSGNYVRFVTSLLFWTGVSFEMPLVVFFLARLNIISAHTLRRSWRYAIVASAVVAAIVTPTFNPFNTILVMGLLAVLYLISILLAALA